MFRGSGNLSVDTIDKEDEDQIVFCFILLAFSGRVLDRVKLHSTGVDHMV